MKKLFSILLICLFLISCRSAGNSYGLSKEDFLYVKRESVHGKLDFKQKLDETVKHNYDGEKYSAREMALLMWGKAVKKIGIKRLKDAIRLYEHIYGYRLKPKERKILKIGFDSN